MAEKLKYLQFLTDVAQVADRDSATGFGDPHVLDHARGNVLRHHTTA